MNKYKKNAIAANIFLMAWFFLDMVSLNIGDNILVTSSYKDDGIFFIIFLVAFVWFVIKDNIGKYILVGWLFVWFTTQFYFHWYFTIFGPWKGKINYFANTIKLIPSSNIYIPDLYHIVLHVLILASLISMIIYCAVCKNKKESNYY
ncbi:hypothetical protein GCM10008905_30960 [Clostridium malenominatum]|uniref:Uncharacterized protein n=1 Tax=Clostridium malenominatum TaxID=1539 RepID=A0ABN1J785_9CLOT